MFASEFLGGCGISSWLTNSQIVHAKSKQPEGPYKRVGVAIGAFAHNPAIAKGPDGRYHLWHLGVGDGADNRTVKNCSNGSSFEPSVTVMHQHRLTHQHWCWDRGSDSGGSTVTRLPCNTSQIVHSSGSLEGPWTPTKTWVNINSGSLRNENPSPLYLRNGSVTLLVNSANDCVQLAMSDNGWKGPYAVPPWRNNTNGTICAHVEDGFLYIDARQHWHALFHMEDSRIGGHAYSTDGIEWSNVSFAYNKTISLVGEPLGTGIQCNRRERPSLMFNEAGTPTHLVTGCCLEPCIWNSTNGMEHSFTAVQPLNT